MIEENDEDERRTRVKLTYNLKTPLAKGKGESRTGRTFYLLDTTEFLVCLHGDDGQLKAGNLEMLKMN